jgi:hypothetical protein
MVRARGRNPAGRVGLCSDGLEWVSLTKNICQVMGRVRIDLVRVGSGFRLNIIGFFLDFGSFRVGFRVLKSLDHFELRVIRVRVGSGYRSSDIR